MKTETLENIYDCLTPERRKLVAQRTMDLMLEVVAEQMLEQSYEPEIHSDPERHDEIVQRQSVKAIMAVLNGWQDRKLDARCAEEIIDAVKFMCST